MGITIQDIARMAGVSTTTVSRVINNKVEGVSEVTRKRILEIVKETKYKPNPLARGLITKKTKTIGLIIPDITNPFFPEIARGVEDIANKNGFNVFLCNTDDDPDKEKKYIEALKEKYVDGIIFTVASNPRYEHINELFDCGIPIVMMDREMEKEDMKCVYIDNFEGGYIATKHLIELGHKNIGCITGPLKSKSAIDRYKGYEKAMIESNIPINKELVIESNYKIEGGILATERLLNNSMLTAIFVCNDAMAYGSYKAIKKRGYSIPEDISIVGFDNIYLSQMVEKELTTVSQPTYDMGVSAAKMLIKVIDGKRINKKHICFKPELIIRESTSKSSCDIDSRNKIKGSRLYE